MHRYAVAGILADVLDGKRVVIVTPPGSFSLRETLEALVAAAPAGVVVRRANGMESVAARDGGGVAWLVRAGGSIRGWTADVVYADTDLSEQMATDARIALQSSGGELIRR